MKKLILILTLLVLAVSSVWAKECPTEPGLPRKVHEALYAAHQMLDRNQPQKAAEGLARFRKSRPDLKHHRLSFMQGMLAYQAGKRLEAEKHLTEAIRLYPCYSLAWRNVAVMQYEAKQYLAAARSSLNAYALTDPPDLELVYQAAVFYLEGGKPAKALQHLKGLSALPKAKPEWLKALIRAHLALKQWEPAAKASRRLLAMQPGDAAIWRLTAGVELSRKRYRRAAADLEVAFRLKPPDASDYLQMAELYRAAGLPNEAANWYLKAIMPDPEPDEWEKLTKIYRQAGQLDKAINAGRKALAEPSISRHLLLAELHLQKRNYAEAADNFAKAGQLSQKGEHFLLAGQCAWQNDDLAGAEKHLDKALVSAKPGTETYHQSKRLLDELAQYQKQAKAIIE